MRLCRFAGGYGLIQGEDVIEITQHVPAIGEDIGDPLVRTLPHLRTLNAEALAKANRHRLADVKLLSPVRNPTKILAAPNNYRDHTAEMQNVDPVASTRMATMEEAGFFLKATSSLVGPSEGVVLRFPTRRTDHEVELVVVIGDVISQPVEAAQAARFIAGYSIGLDITLRGPEERSLRKSIDTYTVLGPSLVTPDEAGDVSKSRMRLSVNGALRQSALLSDMVFNVEEQIAYASRFYTLYPGDLIYTGTPAGVGPIRPGDVIHADISKLGEIDVYVR
ncbi:fumarylacetoacetate hydrolase family protein [Roseiarcaceae bacterium H3SJ34-1]|uniref:fumarylacetoacetate hydrolase family protein n=1 Tax=Terripilifer ovatus TaxID=3032367 RepID=UPI003AB9252F|nr:fumarylacetoacetate hydrolase family protein [Roseiarcaceae bacterium H3SJ34-1]